MIEISEEIRTQMVEHAIREFPNEACGLLGGSPAAANGVAPAARAERFYPMTNADASPVTYRLDPKEQFTVTAEIDDLGSSVVGIFHSHTHSPAFPSETDRSQAAFVEPFYPDAHFLLLSLADRDDPVMRGFTIRDGEVEEQEVSIR
jgi:[CysO sulfur-carrier protein]-S-L-cysteine hydrolase